MDQKKTTEEHLCALHQALKYQFLCMEMTYEAYKGTFEVKIDGNNNISSHDKDGEGDDGALVCVPTVEFEDGLESTRWNPKMKNTYV